MCGRFVKLEKNSKLSSVILKFILKTIYLKKKKKILEKDWNDFMSIGLFCINAIQFEHGPMKRLQLFN